ncbi:NeuD/PglB/VioB family sugar acetyltransferase [Curtobacterium flaccumfaciens pv. beticola]|uniref:NeuD/PglB/VioB family sugar acetyltransferase n=1 Tax=Curtobacterium flaccumfaciens TaxID=2035 RepID=UPI00349FA932|nr:NeuD/PglB/VioB family sugar acetyltransferase [Curtobacterium flaccumfaciens pv. basellae]
MTGKGAITIIGGGGFGRETADVVRAAGLEVLGVVDDAPSPSALQVLDRMEILHLGDLTTWLIDAEDAHYVIAINDPAVRASIDQRATAAGAVAATVVHPSASVGSLVELGPGAVVCASAVIGSHVRAGRHLHCNPGAVVGHDVSLGDHVSLNPRATVSGTVSIGARTVVGAGAVVLQDRTIGADAVVAASACVTRDVTGRTTVVGVPARPR